MTREDKLDSLLTSLGLPPLAQELAYAQSCISGPYARLVGRLTTLLGCIEHDTEHRQLTIIRSDLDHLVPGQLFAVEISFPRGRQPRLYINYVYEVTATGATFRGGRGLMPLTIAGLRRAIRDAKRSPAWTTSAHVTAPGQLAEDLGLTRAK